MRILIIGGTGLISKYFVQEMAKSGADLTVANRGKTEVPLPEGVKSIVVDRTDYPNFERTMAEMGPWDVVVDMVGYQPEDGRSVVRAFGGKVRQFIFCSTVDVYRKYPDEYPIGPNVDQSGMGDYAAKKVEIEATLREAHRDGAFQLTTIRPALTYGEGRGFWPTCWPAGYIHRLRTGQPVVVHGDGTALWTFAHAEDVARAFQGAIGNERAFGKEYNAAGEEWIPWDRFHEIVAELAGAPKPNLVHIPSRLLAAATERGSVLPINFMFCNLFDNESAKRDLGYEYRIDFRTGAQRILKWLEENDQTGPANDPEYDRLITLWEELQADYVRKFRALQPGS
jgi:nucleoside-diphosphate-sugar epimerase